MKDRCQFQLRKKVEEENKEKVKEEREEEEDKEDESDVEDNQASKKKTVDKKDNEYCRDFINGNCRFERERWREHISRRDFKKTIECKYHNENRCKWGIRCEYKHMIERICKRFSEDQECWMKDRCQFLHKTEKEQTEDRNTVKEKSSAQDSKTKQESVAQKKVDKDFLEILDTKMKKQEELLDKRVRRLEKLFEDAVTGKLDIKITQEK